MEMTLIDQLKMMGPGAAFVMLYMAGVFASVFVMGVLTPILIVKGVWYMIEDSLIYPNGKSPQRVIVVATDPTATRKPARLVFPVESLAEVSADGGTSGSSEPVTFPAMGGRKGSKADDEAPKE